MLVLNPDNEDDSKIIKFLEKKKFSGYVRQLILEDMKKNNNLEIRDLIDEIKKLREDMFEANVSDKRSTGARNNSASAISCENPTEVVEENETDKGTEKEIEENSFKNEETEKKVEKVNEVRSLFEDFMG